MVFSHCQFVYSRSSGAAFVVAAAVAPLLSAFRTLYARSLFHIPTSSHISLVPIKLTGEERTRKKKREDASIQAREEGEGLDMKGPTKRRNYALNIFGKGKASRPGEDDHARTDALGANLQGDNGPTHAQEMTY